MIASAHFRCGGSAGREPIAAPGDITSLAAKFTAHQTYWGKITSRPPERLSKEDIALAAFRLGVKPAALLAAIQSGVIGGVDAR